MSLFARIFNKKAKTNTDKIINSLNLKPNWKVADLGAGGGYFSFQFAKKVKRIYSLDINKKFLNFIKKQAEKQKIKNIKTIEIKNKVEIPEKVDLIFTRNVYHHLKDRVNYFKQLKPYLKKNGKIVIIDWKKGKSFIGHFTKRQTIIDELKKAGYKLFNEFELPKQNFLIFKK